MSTKRHKWVGQKRSRERKEGKEEWLVTRRGGRIDERMVGGRVCGQGNLEGNQSERGVYPKITLRLLA